MKIKLFKLTMAYLIAMSILYCVHKPTVTTSTKSIETDTIYMVYGGTPEMFGGVEVVHTCETYQEAIDFCNKEPISDPCVIIEGKAFVPPCFKDKDGNPVEWGKEYEEI